MRTLVSSIVFFVSLLLGSHAFAWQAYCEDGRCGTNLASSCNPYESYCQCTDPICNRPMYSNCISRAYCCEAFGNIGAR